MISYKHLSKLIQTRDSKRTENVLVLMYNKLSVSERKEIKAMLLKNKYN